MFCTAAVQKERKLTQSSLLKSFSASSLTDADMQHPAFVHSFQKNLTVLCVCVCVCAAPAGLNRFERVTPPNKM
jgi:hypothetical protein